MNALRCPERAYWMWDAAAGFLSEAMAALGAEVTGIDVGEAPLAVAKHHLAESGLLVNYQRSTAEEFSEAHPERYDIVTCMELLEHVPNPQSRGVGL